MQKIDNTFLSSAYVQVPRLLGQLNRNPSSHSYGSFDRAFWHYRTNDISCCRYQEAVYTLTLLYSTPLEGNQYYQDDKVLEWIRASLRFTATIQRKNGSFDEWYIHEGSYVGTAFLTAALCQTVLLLRTQKIELPEDDLVCAVIGRAASFLTKTTEKTVLNQVSGAIFALAAAGKLLSRKEFSLMADALLDAFLKKQSKEGWWSEYGGPDIGYLSLTISYLCKYRILTGSEKPREAIAKAQTFAEAFVHPDGTAGGEYMSRNTEYLVPSEDLPYFGAVSPEHLDDRYLCYILYNWIETGIKLKPKKASQVDGTCYYKESSLLSYRKGNLLLVVNGKKGGSLRVYIGNRVYYDSGLEIESSGTICSTGILDAKNSVTYENQRLCVTGVAKVLKEPLMTTPVMILFKTWQLLMGRFSLLQKFIKVILRRRMISEAGESNVYFERVIEYTNDSIIIQDTVRGLDAEKDAILFGVKSAYTAVPSSKYASVPGLSHVALTPVVKKEVRESIAIIRRIIKND